MRQKKVGIPAVQQQEISLENNRNRKTNHAIQVNQMKKLLILVAFLLVILIILLIAIFFHQNQQQTSIVPKNVQLIETNLRNETLALNSLEIKQGSNKQDKNHREQVLQSKIQEVHTQIDENKTLAESYKQSLLNNREIYAFMKKRAALFMNHLSPYLKMAPLALKEQIGKSQINNQQFGRAVKLITYAPLILNNSQKISLALASEKKYYESQYDISSYPQIEFCVVVPTYKNFNKFRYFLNLYTIMQQDYDRYHVVIIDDASGDHTADKLQKEISNNPYVKKRVTLIKNEKREYHMANIYNAVHNYCRPGEILAVVDGDDELVGKQVFKLFNAAYHKTKAFSIYSNYIQSKKDVALEMGISQPYPPQVIKQNNYRQVKHYYSHLKTAWVDLFLQIKQESLKTKEGKWYNNAVDNAIFLSIFEMTCERIYYLPEITYKYNTFTGNSIANMDYNYRKATADEIKAKAKYRCINETSPEIYQRIISYMHR